MALAMHLSLSTGLVMPNVPAMRQPTVVTACAGIRCAATATTTDTELMGVVVATTAPPPEGFEWSTLPEFGGPPAPVDPPPSPAPAEKTEPAKKTTDASSEWPMLGGSNKAYKVKSGTREAWTPPEGWTKPTKPVQSWYDKGDRLDAAPRAYPYVRSWYDLGLTL